MIKLIAIGNLGKDCQVNDVNGNSVINFNVAHTEKYKDQKGVAHQKTTWVSCAYWTENLKVAEYLLKGKQVYVEGIPEVRTYETQQGQTVAQLSLRVFNIQLLGGVPKDSQTGGEAEETEEAEETPPATTKAKPVEKVPVKKAQPRQSPVATDEEPPF